MLKIKIVFIKLYNIIKIEKKTRKVGLDDSKTGVLKKGPFWAPLRVGQIGGKLHLAHAKPS